jgi:hypothetical protein
LEAFYGIMEFVWVAIQEWRYELNSELMWAFSRVSQNRDIDDVYLVG